MEGSSRRSTKGFGCEGIRCAALSGGHCCGCGSAECRCGADDGAYIAGVLHAGQYDDQRNGTVGGWPGDVVESESARGDESGDALGVFGVGDAFEETVGGLQDRDGDLGAVEIRREAAAVAFARFAEENSTYGRGGAKRFFDEAGTFYADGAGFRWQSAAQSDAEFLEPAVVAAGDDSWHG